MYSDIQKTFSWLKRKNPMRMRVKVVGKYCSIDDDYGL
jgi:hypothetical protein